MINLSLARSNLVPMEVIYTLLAHDLTPSQRCFGCLSNHSSPIAKTHIKQDQQGPLTKQHLAKLAFGSGSSGSQSRRPEERFWRRMVTDVALRWFRSTELLASFVFKSLRCPLCCYSSKQIGISKTERRTIPRRMSCSFARFSFRLSQCL